MHLHIALKWVSNGLSFSTNVRAGTGYTVHGCICKVLPEKPNIASDFFNVLLGKNLREQDSYFNQPEMKERLRSAVPKKTRLFLKFGISVGRYGKSPKYRLKSPKYHLFYFQMTI